MSNPYSIDIQIIQEPEGYKFIIGSNGEEWFRTFVFIQIEGKFPSNLFTPEMMDLRFNAILDQIHDEFGGEAITMEFKYRFHQRFIELL